MNKNRANIKFYLIIGLLIVAMIPMTKYSLSYMHWLTKAKGYPGLYEQTNYYTFNQASEFLILHDQWQIITNDPKGDGDIPNWHDAKSLSLLTLNDTLWVRFRSYNNIDINEPMITLAIESPKGNSWYGTVDNFKYDKMITTGYTREGTSYKGYNYIGDTHGICTMQYDIEGNAFYLGIPMRSLKQFDQIRFVASIGNKGLWNDDFGNKVYEIP